MHFKLLVVILASICCASACVHPPLPPDYTNEAYIGEWYEIGRVRHANFLTVSLRLMREKTTTASSVICVDPNTRWS